MRSPSGRGALDPRHIRRGDAPQPPRDRHARHRSAGPPALPRLHGGEHSPNALPGGTTMDVVQTYTFVDSSDGRPDGRAHPRAAHDPRSSSGRSPHVRRRRHAHVFGRACDVSISNAATMRRSNACGEALTDEAAKQKWFGGPPGEWELLERHMDVREGGRERAKGRWKSGAVSTFDAIYHDVVPHRAACLQL